MNGFMISFFAKVKFKIGLVFVLILSIMLSSSYVSAERQRLERKHGVVNQALQDMLEAQIAAFPSGIGKVEMGRGSGFKVSCTMDLFVSPETIFVALASKKTSSKAEFYVDHPHDSFRSVLFQALVTKGEERELSVDLKTGGYKFTIKGNDFDVKVKQKGTETSCEFDLAKAVLKPGETE